MSWHPVAALYEKGWKVAQMKGQIIIDGKTFIYTLEPVGDTTAIPIPAETVRTPQANGGGEVYTVLLLGHDMKTGTGKNGKPYERHSFKASDNRTYQTFRNEIVAVLSPLVGKETPVKLVAKKHPQFSSYDIVRVEGA